MEAAKVIQFPARQVDGETWEPMVDEKAIAHHFAVTTRTIRRWRAQGMPAVALRNGGHRYKISACERWHEEAA